MSNAKTTKLTVGEVAAVTTSALSGMVIGIKAGTAIGSLFGPLGLVVGPIIGAFCGQAAFMRRTMATKEPIAQAVRDVIRVGAGGLMHTPDSPTNDHACQTPEQR